MSGALVGLSLAAEGGLGAATTTLALTAKLGLFGGIAVGAAVVGLPIYDYMTKNPDEVFDKFKEETYTKALNGEKIDREFYPLLLAHLKNEEFILDFENISWDDRDSRFFDAATVNLGAPDYSLAPEEKATIINQILQQDDAQVLADLGLTLFNIIGNDYLTSNFDDAVTAQLKRLLLESPPRQVSGLRDPGILASEATGGRFSGSQALPEARIILKANNADGLTDVTLPVDTFAEEVRQIGSSLVSVRNFDDLLVDVQSSQYTPQVLLEKYGQFIFDQVEQDLANRSIQQATRTLGTIFQTRVSQAANLIYEAILRTSEDARRIELIREGLAETEPPEDPLLSGNVEQAENRAINSILGVASTIPPEEELTEEQREANLSIVSQCALLLNIKKLKQANRDDILLNIKDDYHNSMPYDERFIMVENPDNNLSAINKMLANKDLSPMFDLENSEIAKLVPKIRLFKQSPDAQDETEFIFAQAEDVNRQRNFSIKGPTFFKNDFDKGSGAGIKEFSFAFNGTSPATSRNDVECSLKLFFQSFSDFVRERKDYNGNKYRFVDLVLQPDPGKKSMNDDFISRLEYRPDYYIIRAEVGYYIPDDFSIEKKNAIMKSNSSLVLTMVDHDIDIQNDGTVEITISYRAYIETALKSFRYDALATPEISKRRIQRLKQYIEILRRDSCTQEELNQIKRAYEAEEEQLISLSLRSIFGRLIQNGKIHTLNINANDRRDFINRGFFRDIPRLSNATGEIINESTEPSDFLAVASGEDELSVINNLLEADPAADLDIFDRLDQINFFYVGDLLYTILDNLNVEIPGIRNLPNTKILLSSIDIPSFRSGDEVVSLNIADIPVSVDYFYEWYTEQVLAKGSTRRTFPILVFIRELCNKLIAPSLLENCYNRNLEKKLRFQSTHITIFDPEFKLEEELITTVDDERLAIDLSTSTSVPFFAMDVSGQDVGDPNSFRPSPHELLNLLIIYPVGKPARHEGTGRFLQDIERGCFHIDIGKNKGIVKTVNFNKTDMQYIREARFVQQNGISDILQLAAVYKTTIEMVGNTIFYPGMELYVNPFGIGGTDLGSPTDAQSIANKLGFGGYHTIISVKSTIKPGSFNTTVVSQQYYSGDGRTRAAESGDYISPSDVAIEEAPSRDQNFCNTAIRAAEIDLSRLVTEGAGAPVIPLEEIEQAAQPVQEAQTKSTDAGTAEQESTGAAALDQFNQSSGNPPADSTTPTEDQQSTSTPDQNYTAPQEKSENPTTPPDTTTEPLPTPPEPPATAPAQPPAAEAPVDNEGPTTISEEAIASQGQRLVYSAPIGVRLMRATDDLKARKITTYGKQEGPNTWYIYSISSSLEFAFTEVKNQVDILSIPLEDQIGDDYSYPRQGGGESYLLPSEAGDLFLVATTFSLEGN